MARHRRRRRLLLPCALVGLAACSADLAHDEQPASNGAKASDNEALRAAQLAIVDPWNLKIASFNLLNLSNNKLGVQGGVATNVQLAQRYEDIFNRYDIVFTQEILNDGNQFTNLHPPGYDCTYFSESSGRSGRRERYGACYLNDGSLSVVGPPIDLVGTSPLAVDNSVQDAADVWMRPPYHLHFVYTHERGGTYDFFVGDMHTKPAYSRGNRPPGTPRFAPASSSVMNELAAWYVANDSPTAPMLLLGDLNADCASYPATNRGDEFHDWSWYVDFGEKTNTALRSSCAYDRLLVNDDLESKVLGYAIDTRGIDERINGRRVSDHFPVRLEIGQRRGTRRALAAYAVAAPATKRRRLSTGSSVGIGGTIGTGAVPLASTTSSAGSGGTMADVYIVPYASDASFDTNARRKLKDVRPGGPTTVMLDASGVLPEGAIVWNGATAGQYSIVVDRNRDGFYNRRRNDAVNEGNGIDFVIDDPRPSGLVVGVDDHDATLTTLDPESLNHMYVAAAGLPKQRDVDVFVVARNRLPPSFTTWDDAKRKGDLDLASVAVPVGLRHGPIDLRTVASLPPETTRATVTTEPDGTLFAPIWREPSSLFHMQALSAPRPKAFPALTETDSEDDFCAYAFASTNPNIAALCNIAPTFVEAYGTSYCVVVDVDRSGKLDQNDLVDGCSARAALSAYKSTALRNTTSDTCLLAGTSSSVASTGCETAEATDWHMVPAAVPGTFSIRDARTGRCLAASSNAAFTVECSTPQAPTDANVPDDAVWNPVPTQDGAVALRNARTSSCLVVSPGAGSVSVGPCDTTPTSPARFTLE